jgi:hypothetical protein
MRHTDHYWQVYFDTSRLIREAFVEAGFPVPGAEFLTSWHRDGSPSIPNSNVDRL